MFTSGKKGFLIVDAACCLPVFLIAIGILLSLIAQCGIEETAQHALVQSARCSAKAFSVSYEKGNGSLAASGAFVAYWESFLYKEWGHEQQNKHIEELSFDEQVFLPAGNISIDYVARATVEMEHKIPLPLTTVHNPVALKKIVFRPFVGESQQRTPYDLARVYVFPESGERYHLLSCYILQSGGVELLLTEKIRREKQPCRICNPQELPNGSKVFTVQNESGIYHRQSCPTITKNYICMSRSEAIAQGYTPCKICGGGEYESSEL